MIKKVYILTNRSFESIGKLSDSLASSYYILNRDIAQLDTNSIALADVILTLPDFSFTSRGRLLFEMCLKLNKPLLSRMCIPGFNPETYRLISHRLVGVNDLSIYEDSIIEQIQTDICQSSAQPSM